MLDMFSQLTTKNNSLKDVKHHVGMKELRSLSWLTIPDRVKFFKLVHLFRIKRGLAPHYLQTNLTSVSDAHRHNTRGSTSNYHVSRSLSATPSSFAFSCVKLWNSLPARIKGIDSFSVFKKDLRDFVLNSYG